jgi:hypothetical protein
MFAMALAAVLFVTPDHEAGFSRLTGTFSGPMKFHDDGDGKDKEMQVRVAISDSSSAPESSWSWQYFYAPGKSAEEKSTVSILNNGKFWQEAEPVTTISAKAVSFRYELTGWTKFCQKQQDWFELKRLVKRGMVGGDNITIRRRFTVTNLGLTSEKWLQYPGQKDWKFDHKMTLTKAN